MPFIQSGIDQNLLYNDNRYVVKTTGAGLQTVDNNVNFTGTVYFNGSLPTSLYYLKTEYLNISAGAADAGKPIVLDATGKIDVSMLHGGDTTYKLISPDGLTDPVLYADNSGDLTAVGHLTTTGDIRIDGGNLGLSSDIDLVAMSNNLFQVNGQIKMEGTSASLIIDATGVNDSYLKFYLDGAEKGSLTLADADEKLTIAAAAGINISNNIAIGANYISYNGANAGISINNSNNVTCSGSLTATGGIITNSITTIAEVFNLGFPSLLPSTTLNITPYLGNFYGNWHVENRQTGTDSVLSIQPATADYDPVIRFNDTTGAQVAKIYVDISAVTRPLRIEPPAAGVVVAGRISATNTISGVDGSFSGLLAATSLKVGSNGSTLLGIVEQSGTTASNGSPTYVDYPSGFNKTNTQVLIAKVLSGGAWYIIGTDRVILR